MRREKAQPTPISQARCRSTESERPHRCCHLPNKVENIDLHAVLYDASEDVRHPSKMLPPLGGSVAEWLACWTQAQKGLGSNRSRDAVG